MESDIFRAGTSPGSPSTQVEIKMLLCYILSQIGQPMSFSQLYEALSEHNLVNYFELVRALSDLSDLGHVEVSAAEDGSDQYAVTELGRRTGGELERSLPLTVREKALEASRRVMGRHRRLTEVRVSDSPCGDGFMLELAIPDRGEDLLCLRVFAPTREERDAMRKGFLNAPLTVYKGVLALLTGDEQVLGNIFTRESKLF